MHEFESKVRQLANFAGQDDANKRREVLYVIADLFFETCEFQGPKELELFETVFEKIASNLSPEDRANVSERFADAKNAPKSFILKLAQDEIDVAEPILRRSPCLSEEDLIALAETLDKPHLYAITGREKLSCLLTKILVDRADDEIIERVSTNTGAELSDDTFNKLGKLAEKNRKALSALSARKDTPDKFVTNIRKSIKELNSSELRKFAKMRRPRPDKVTEKLLKDLANSKLLHKSIRCLSLLTGHPDSFARHCLLEGNISALSRLCKANGFETSTFAALLKLRSQVSQMEGASIADAIRFYRRLPRRTAQRSLGYEEVKEAIIQ